MLMVMWYRQYVTLVVLLHIRAGLAEEVDYWLQHNADMQERYLRDYDIIEDDSSIQMNEQDRQTRRSRSWVVTSGKTYKIIHGRFGGPDREKGRMKDIGGTGISRRDRWGNSTKALNKVDRFRNRRVLMADGDYYTWADAEYGCQSDRECAKPSRGPAFYTTDVRPVLPEVEFEMDPIHDEVAAMFYDMAYGEVRMAADQLRSHLRSISDYGVSDAIDRLDRQMVKDRRHQASKGIIDIDDQETEIIGKSVAFGQHESDFEPAIQDPELEKSLKRIAIQDHGRTVMMMAVAH